MFFTDSSSKWIKRKKKKSHLFIYKKLKKKVDLSLFYIIRITVNLQKITWEWSLFDFVYVRSRENTGIMAMGLLWYSRTIILRDRSIDRGLIAIRQDCVCRILSLLPALYRAVVMPKLVLSRLLIKMANGEKCSYSWALTITLYTYCKCIHDSVRSADAKRVIQPLSIL